MDEHWQRDIGRKIGPGEDGAASFPIAPWQSEGIISNAALSERRNRGTASFKFGDTKHS